MIFAKKHLNKACKVQPEVIALEHLLAVVSKLYYKQNFKMHEFLELFSLPDDYEEPQAALSKKNKRQTSSKKKRLQSAATGQSGGLETRDEEEDDIKVAAEAFGNGLSVLEKLVTPLNVGFDFGSLGLL